MAEPLRLVLHVREDCEACGRARELMSSLSAAMRFEWSVEQAAPSDNVPLVTTADGRLLAEAPIATGELVDAIVALATPLAAPPPD